MKIHARCSMAISLATCVVPGIAFFAFEGE